MNWHFCSVCIMSFFWGQVLCIPRGFQGSALCIISVLFILKTSLYQRNHKVFLFANLKLKGLRFLKPFHEWE